jgi:hypothetical protein
VIKIFISTSLSTVLVLLLMVLVVTYSGQKVVITREEWAFASFLSLAVSWLYSIFYFGSDVQIVEKE